MLGDERPRCHGGARSQSSTTACGLTEQEPAAAPTGTMDTQGWNDSQQSVLQEASGEVPDPTSTSPTQPTGPGALSLWTSSNSPCGKSTRPRQPLFPGRWPSLPGTEASELTGQKSGKRPGALKEWSGCGPLRSEVHSLAGCEYLLGRGSAFSNPGPTKCYQRQAGRGPERRSFLFTFLPVEGKPRTLDTGAPPRAEARLSGAGRVWLEPG